MILVHGGDALVGDIVRYLTDLRQDAEALGGDQDPFEEVVARRADVLIGVLSPHAAPETARALVEDLIRAGSATRPPIVVLISALSEQDALVRQLKRSGAAYLLISHATTHSHSHAGASGLVVWLSQELAMRPSPRATQADLLATLARALAPDAPVGIALTPGPSTWDAVLTERGYSVRRVPNWFARAAAWWGRPAAYLDGDEHVLKLAPSKASWWRQTLRLPSTT